ncbi:arylamine N-acetyltransferase [Paenibacillus endophyticus]|uniref:Arylamine N-acetyltransferase n=1 Tax=Paenibacillus endophyticus TaxID=1294268 RepID=A0A7W5CAJ8_9BACL|nr:arylamine N-acetyltransferase [Paenibacillus endophyticus]MBB3153169.1 arylamine N-acetyltransferase [Paenibacillus endophyticus]
MITLTAQEIRAYLNRIGIVDIEAPTPTFLFELHKAHVRALSWQTVDIYGGKPASIDVKQSIALILGGRSGYCFHLNGAFSALLHALGYDVSLHRAGVQPIGTEPRINSFHLGVLVRLMDKAWIVDVGLGDMPHEPLPLVYGTYGQAPYEYRVESSLVAPDGWRLAHDRDASFVGVDFDPNVVEDIGIFKNNHHFYSTSKNSPWHNIFLLRNRDEKEGHELRGCMWRKRDKDGFQMTELNQKSHWLDVMAEQLGETLTHYNAIERDELWKRVREDHETWKKQKKQFI